jgi:hypothetical protein
MPPFLDASASPDGDLVKEVYAHFGLCMYCAQVFEIGLINILTALEAERSKTPIRATYDRLYQQHEGLTFGNLIKALSRHDFLTAEVLEEALRLKAERDDLAHRFFRDHDMDFMSLGGCYLMIEELEERRERFITLDARVSALQAGAFKKLGFTLETFEASYNAAMTQMLQEARTKFSSRLEGRRHSLEEKTPRREVGSAPSSSWRGR